MILTYFRVTEVVMIRYFNLTYYMKDFFPRKE